MESLATYYRKTVVPRLKEQFGYTNVSAVPSVKKIVINVGISAQRKDAKTEEMTRETLRKITGQQPISTLAKIAISNFKIRKGMVVGMSVTLRGRRMYDFLTKLIHVTLPRVRDFRGLKTSSVDPNGNCTIGFRESIAFPEIRSDEVERVHGLEVSMVTNARNRERGLGLFRLLGLPFQEK